MSFHLLSTLVRMVDVLLMLSFKSDLFAAILGFLLVEALGVVLVEGVEVGVKQWRL